MIDKQIKEIRQRLDRDLSLEKFERDYRSAGEAATQFFQELFVQVLNFDETTSPMGDATWQDIPVHDWPNTTRANAARLFAESGNFRVIYVELEKLTRTAERNAIQSLTRSDRTSGWAIDGSFLTVFHAPDEDIWHLVTPYEEGTDDITTGRPVLRRYTLGEGETHRTVANALSNMDASKGRLAERIDEAFRVKPVTKDFYENYKSAFDTLSKELRRKGLEIEDADRYAHTTLNRLMFFYYLQKKGWIGDRKDFVRWFHEQYQESDEEDVFHEKWLSALFFEGMNSPEGGKIDADLPSGVESAIAGLPYMNGGLFQPTEEDEINIFLSDSALESVIEEFLEQYNFTVTEESPYDIDVAVDPAMLGKIYESLIAEQERGEAGIFYTPRVEVDLMCRMALYEQFCDHANELDAEGKQRIVEFIFSEPQDWDADSGETEQLENILHELRIVDPACGSGAFLVGMKQVLTELYRKLGTTPDYPLKEQIINENLYGVDIKDWAVRVAEFRLWLSLVEGEEQLPDQRPVLPNFSFKLKVGDSLIQKLDGEFISLDTLTRTLDGDTGNLLTELKELKREHFEGEANRSQKIEEKQIELLRSYINDQIDSLSSGGTQETLFGDTKDELSDEVEGRIDDLRETRDTIDSAGDTGFFMWDIDFSDVMVEGGFDIVIGNPPYVRQKEIIDQGIHPEILDQMDGEDVKKLKKQYKNDLVAYVEDTFGISPYKRSDLYVYFFFRGLDVLRNGGTLTFITSNSWLDVNYGQRLQEGLMRFGDIQYLLDNRAGPIFDEADVNTVIAMARRTAGTGSLTGDASFVTFNDHYENIVRADVMDEVLVGGENRSTIEYQDQVLTYTSVESGRRVTIPESSLWQLGGGVIENGSESGSSSSVYSEKTGVDGAQSGLTSYGESGDAPKPAGSYSGDEKWSQYLQAPDIYFEILEQNQDLLIPLGEIVEVFRGATTGNNSFFYPDQETIDNFDLPDEYLHLTMKSPRSLNRPLVTDDDLDTQVITIPENPDHPALQKYIEYGEEEEIHTGSTVSGRDPWYALEDEIEKTQLFWRKTHYTTHLTYYSESPYYLDQRFYGIKIDDTAEIDSKTLAAILNSTYYALMKILYGREMSGRCVEAAVYEVEKFPIPDPSQINESQKEELRNAFEDMWERDAEAIYDEFDESARQNLDGALFDLLDLSEEQHNALYHSVEHLTRQIRERDKQR